MRIPVLKMEENRVRRMYLGGAGIERLHGRSPKDSDCPEEWIASLVSAQNSEMPLIEKEGISKIDLKQQTLYLDDIINTDPQYYLGIKQYAAIGSQIGVLVKILDSAMRLAIQVHPDRQYARQYLNSMWGKREAYYIADIREGIEPCIYLGFKKTIQADILKRMIQAQDIIGLLDSLNKITVRKDEVWYIPAGMVHAIGEGITMIEMMEPSDWVVRCEFERIPGKIFPPEARFMGKTIDEVMDIFDLNGYSQQQLHEFFSPKQTTIEANEHYILKQGISETLTDCYGMYIAYIFDEFCLNTVYRPRIIIVLHGSGMLESDSEKTVFSSGDSFFIAAEADNIRIRAGGDDSVKLCIVIPKPY